MSEENRPEGMGAPLPPEQYPPVQQPNEPEKRHVHHSYIWLGTLQVSFSLFVAFFIMIFFTILRDEPISVGGQNIGSTAVFGIGAIVLFLVIVGISAIMQVLSYRHLYYELGPDEFNLYSGIFNKKRVHVPYQRVQSVNQKATLVQRIVGVCFVHIDTAGGSANKAVTIPYLQNTEAERLRAEIFARKQAMIAGQGAQAAAQPSVSQVASAQSGASNVLDAPAEILSDVRGVFGGAALNTGQVTYEYGMSNKELILTGLSNNTGFVLIVLAAIGGVAGLAEQVLSTAIGRMVLDGGISFVMSSFAGNAIWAITGIVVLVFLAVWLFSIIGACISYGGFKARRRDSRIEIE
ncbi:MAG: PH domain-containing protein, partial [Raoultibacter sp.]